MDIKRKAKFKDHYVSPRKTVGPSIRACCNGSDLLPSIDVYFSPVLMSLLQIIVFVATVVYLDCLR